MIFDGKLGCVKLKGESSGRVAARVESEKASDESSALGGRKS